MHLSTWVSYIITISMQVVYVNYSVAYFFHTFPVVVRVLYIAIPQDDSNTATARKRGGCI